MGICVVSVAAIRVGGIAVRLDFTGGGALETSWAWGELHNTSCEHRYSSRSYMKSKITYATGVASTNVVRKARDVAGVTHEDCRLDHVDGRGLDGDRCVAQTFVGISTTTESVIHYLTALY